MIILALEHELPGATSELFTRYAKEEARVAWDLYQSGPIRELYFRTDQDAAVLMLECASIDEAESILARLPFVRESLIRFDLIPLKAYSGFGRLFDQKN
jgi:hypothetical protein